MTTLRIGVKGVLVYDKPLILEGGRYEQRFSNIKDLQEHMFYKANHFKSVDLENYNLNDDEWSELEKTVNCIRRFDDKFRSKHNKFNELRYFRTLKRYASRWYGIKVEDGQ